MAAILDHLTAIIVGAVLLGLLIFLQQRNQQVAVATTMKYAADAQSFTLTDILERDIENIQSELITGSRPQLWRENGHTSRFAFHTLAVPDSGEASPILGVAYRVEPVYDTVMVAGRRRPVYRIVRFVNDGGGFVRSGGSTETVLDFDVDFVAQDGSVTDTGPAPDGLRTINARFISVSGSPELITADQRDTFGPAVSQQQIALRPPALNVTLAPDYEPLEIPDVHAPLPAVPAPEPEPDACPDQPGWQAPGTHCVADACPNAPGWQAPGTDCNADACPSQPGVQPPGTTCVPDACPLWDGWQPPGTSCADACPEPGYQPPGSICTPDACPAQPGWQAPGTQCAADACPNAPGWQAPGTDCNADACPNQPGYQPLGTQCIPDACPAQPGWQAPGETCIPDACPEPGWQAPGTQCIPDACPGPDMPGWQAPGTQCLPPDACPNLEGYQPPGTSCTLPGI